MNKVFGIVLCIAIFVSVFAGMNVFASDNGAVSFFKSDYIKVAGTISPEDIREEDYTFEGKDVTLTLVNKSTGDVDYLSQATLDEDGNFEFGFYQDGLTYGNDAVTSHEVKLNLSGKNVTNSITTSSVISKFISITLLPAYDSFNDKVKLNALIRNQYGVPIEYSLMAVFYGDGDRMIDVKKLSDNVSENAGDEYNTFMEAYSMPVGTKMVKFFAWHNEEDILPLSKTREFDPNGNIDDKLKIIFKLDDLGYNSYKKYDRAYEYFKSYGISQISMGAIAHYWYDYYDKEDYETAFLPTVRKWIADGVEIWHHGDLHKLSSYDEGAPINDYNYENFLEDSYEMQLYHIQKAIDTIEGDIGGGYKLRFFGAPANKMSATTIQALKNVGIEGVMYGSASLFKNETELINLEGNSIEAGMGNPTLEKTVAAVEEAESEGRDYVVLQAHAYFNDDAAYREMDRIMAYFMSRDDIVFMTPSQYYDYKYSK